MRQSEDRRQKRLLDASIRREVDKLKRNRGTNCTFSRTEPQKIERNIDGNLIECLSKTK